MENKEIEIPVMHTQGSDHHILTKHDPDPRAILTTTSDLHQSTTHIISEQRKPKSRKRGLFYEIAHGNILSILHFGFGVKLIFFIRSLKRKKKHLSLDDLGPGSRRHNTQNYEEAFTKLYYHFQKKHPGKKRILAFTILKLYKRDLLIQIILQAIYYTSCVSFVWFLERMIVTIHDENASEGKVFSYAVGIFLFSLLRFYSNSHMNFHAARLGAYIKTGLLAMIFRKVNKISMYAVHRLDAGKLMNVISTDVNGLDQFFLLVNVFLTPFYLGGMLGMLLHFWGVEAFVGPFYYILVYLFIMIIFSCTKGIIRRRAELTEKRLNLLVEAVKGVRTLKMYAWDMFKVNQIKAVRDQEIRYLKKGYMIQAIARSLNRTANWTAYYFTFLIQIERFNEINLYRLFPTIVLYGYFKLYNMNPAFQGIQLYTDLQIMSERINQLMELSESDPSGIEPVEDSKNAIEYRDFSSYWTNHDQPLQHLKSNTGRPEGHHFPLVSNINLQVEKGSLTVITGRIGSGKTSLLFALLEEMSHTTGSLRCTGECVYVGQKPLFHSGSLKDAVLFGRPYNGERFWKVMDVCCLRTTIRGLPKREMTEVGDFGAFMDGKTLKKIGLARALYADASIYLLDDLFSGIDIKTANILFHRAIQVFLKGKTVMLVTHNLNLLKYADQIVIMKKGTVSLKGTPSELIKNQEAMDTQMDDCCVNKAARCKFEEVDEDPDDRMETNPEEKEEARHHGPALGTLIADKIKRITVFMRILDGSSTSLRMYGKYLYSAFNWFRLPLMIVLFIVSDGAVYASSRLWQAWAEHHFSMTEGEIVLSVFIVSVLILHFLKHLLYYDSMLNSAREIHDKMLKNILISPYTFYETNSIGKIVSRFSVDINVLDNVSLFQLLSTCEAGVIIIILSITLWIYDAWILLTVGIWLIFLIILFYWSKPAIVEAKQLELKTKDPVTTYFFHHIRSITMFRRPKEIEERMKIFCKKSDDYLKASIASGLCAQTFLFIISYIAELSIIVTFCICIHYRNTAFLNSIFINILIMLPIEQQWFLRSITAFRGLATSVARLIHTNENTPKAPLDRVDDEKLRAAGWPQTGEIEVKNINPGFFEQYDSSREERSWLVKGGEKIATIGKFRGGGSLFPHLLGRTIKTSIETSEDHYIKIDGVNINDVGLHLLRRSMTMISENAHIFNGTIRENLDPTGSHKDEDLWKVLQDVGLREMVEKSPLQLNTVIMTYGFFFSFGQKRLLTIARGLLKSSSKILIVDDVTGCLDLATDVKMQRLIAERFKHATILARSVRLWSSCYFDKVLVAESGVGFNYDEPYKLLVKNAGDTTITNKQDFYATLILGYDDKIASKIFEKAKELYYKRHSTIPLEVECEPKPQRINQLALTEKEEMEKGELLNPLTIGELVVGDLASEILLK